MVSSRAVDMFRRIGLRAASCAAGALFGCVAIAHNRHRAPLLVACRSDSHTAFESSHGPWTHFAFPNKPSPPRHQSLIASWRQMQHEVIGAAQRRSAAVVPPAACCNATPRHARQAVEGMRPRRGMRAHAFSAQSLAQPVFAFSHRLIRGQSAISSYSCHCTPFRKSPPTMARWERSRFGAIVHSVVLCAVFVLLLLSTRESSDSRPATSWSAACGLPLWLPAPPCAAGSPALR